MKSRRVTFFFFVSQELSCKVISSVIKHKIHAQRKGFRDMRGCYQLLPVCNQPSSRSVCLVGNLLNNCQQSLSANM